LTSTLLRDLVATMAGTSSPGVGEPRSGEPAATGPPRGRLLGAPAWQPWTVGVAFLGVVGLVLAGRETVPGGGAGLPLGNAIALILLNVAPIGLALLLANMHGRPTASDFGLRRPPLRRAIALLLAVWAGLTTLTILWVVALGIDDEEGPLTERLGTDGTLTVLVLIVVLTILAPLGEEFLFRGYIFRALNNWRGVWPAAITTGVLFAATHVGWLPIAVMVPVVVFGIGLCLLYHWTGSLYPGIALHAIFNSIPLGAALDWTWQIPLLIACSTLATLTLARLIARRLGDRHPVRRRAPPGSRSRA